VDLVEGSDYFTLNPDAPSRCPADTGCGRVDVNGDGKVTQLDSTSITQSAVLGSNVTCGAVYATAFSCGSTRSAPLTPAISISLDTINYFSDDGEIVEGKLLHNHFERSRGDTGLMDNILMEFDQIQAKVNQLEEREQMLEEELLESKKRHHHSEQNIERLALFNKVVRSDGHGLVIDVFISIAVVLGCGVLVLALQKSGRIF
jgi:hypothetical protein